MNSFYEYKFVLGRKKGAGRTSSRNWKLEGRLFSRKVEGTSRPSSLLRSKRSCISSLPRATCALSVFNRVGLGARFLFIRSKVALAPSPVAYRLRHNRAIRQAYRPCAATVGLGLMVLGGIVQFPQRRGSEHRMLVHHRDLPTSCSVAPSLQSHRWQWKMPQSHLAVPQVINRPMSCFCGGLFVPGELPWRSGTSVWNGLVIGNPLALIDRRSAVSALSKSATSSLAESLI